MAKDIKIEDKNKLVQQSADIRAELRKLRFDLALSQLDDTSKIKKKRKELAQVHTSLSKIKVLEGVQALESLHIKANKG